MKMTGVMARRMTRTTVGKNDWSKNEKNSYKKSFEILSGQSCLDRLKHVINIFGGYKSYCQKYVYEEYVSSISYNVDS